MEKSNRRKFLQNTGLIISGTLLGITDSKSREQNSDNSAEQSLGLPSKSRVADIRMPDKFSLEKSSDVVSINALLGSALRTYFDSSDPRDGLRSLFKPEDIVGIKVNCLSGRFMSTHTGLVSALVKMLIQTGIDEDNIIVWDRTDRDLTGGGYKLNKGKGVKVYGADYAGFSENLLIHRSIGSFTANIMQKADKIINMPVLKDHGIVGVTLGLKNYFGAIHNPHKYHLKGGDPYVADLYSHPMFKDKTALTIVDGIVGQYEGGPPHQPQWTWNHGGLLIGEDTVAVDRTGLDIIEKKRADEDIPSLTELTRYPKYLETAERLGIGNFRKEKIDIIYG